MFFARLIAGLSGTVRFPYTATIRFAGLFVPTVLGGAASLLVDPLGHDLSPFVDYVMGVSFLFWYPRQDSNLQPTA